MSWKIILEIICLMGFSVFILWIGTPKETDSDIYDSVYSKEP